MIKVSAGRSGWQNKNNFKSNLFEKLFQFPEGKIMKEKFNNNLNYVRIISKREKGKLSNREQIIDLIRISYTDTKKDKLNIKEFKKIQTQVVRLYTKLKGLNVYTELSKENLTNLVKDFFVD